MNIGRNPQRPTKIGVNDEIAIQYWQKKAEQLLKMQGKTSVSVQEMVSLFNKEFIKVDDKTLEKIAGEDKKFDKKELSMLFYMLDGTKKYDHKDPSKYWIEHDYCVEANGYREGRGNGVTVYEVGDKNPLKDTLLNTATQEEIDAIKKAFDLYGKPEFGLNNKESNNPQMQEKVGIIPTITDEEYQAKLEKDVDEILKGKSSIKVSEFRNTPIYKTLQKQLEPKFGNINFAQVIWQDEEMGLTDAPGQIIKGSKQTNFDDIEISRNELKTLLMIADAELVKVDGEEKFVFDSKYESSESSGLKEMTKDELWLIYSIMDMRSEIGPENTKIMLDEME